MRMRCKVLVFGLLSGMEALDLISDSLVCADVMSSEDGLVFGRPESGLVKALLAFSIIGVFTFLMESTNLWWEIFRDNPWLNNYFVSVFTIWLEDVPQIVINLILVICREEPISYFQLVKASLALAALFVRIVYSLHKYCRRQEKCGCSRHEFTIALIMIGLLLNAACAIPIFVFTQTSRDKDGNIKVHSPSSVFEDQYNDQRYFQNVSIFVHQPEFDQNRLSTQQTHWMRLLSISDLKDHPDLGHSYNVVYESRGDRMIVAVYNKISTRKVQWSLAECFSFDLTTRHLAPQYDTVCQNVGAAAASYYITFSFTSPSTFPRRLIFGDVRYNIKKFAAGQCVEFGSAGPLLQYFRVGAHLPLSQQKHILQQTQGQPRFYRSNGADLEDVSKVWKTGWWQCDSSGSKAPHLDPSIATDCSNSPNSVNG